MPRFALALIALLACAAPAAAQWRDVTPVHGDPTIPLQPYAALDLERYAGLWYEVARFPNRHQRRCQAVTAEYAPRPDGHFAVRGVCPDIDPAEGVTEAEGVARVEGPAELSLGLNAWLPVFRRTVIVLDVSDDYAVAVVGEARRKYGWVLAREPQVDEAQFARARDVLARNGYFVDLLERLPPAQIVR